MAAVPSIFIVFLCIITLGHSQISLPFSVQSELRVKFQSVVTDSKLSIFQDYISSLSCAPYMTITFRPKQNAYISYFIMQWSKDGANVFYKKVQVEAYLYTNQDFTIKQQITTLNCQEGGKTEYSYQPGKYSFVFTLWDNNKRTEIIGKMTATEELECSLMNSGCWANKACYYNTNCKPKGFLEIEKKEDIEQQS